MELIVGLNIQRYNFSRNLKLCEFWCLTLMEEQKLKFMKTFLDLESDHVGNLDALDRSRALAK
jgi:hypothetical protein